MANGDTRKEIDSLLDTLDRILDEPDSFSPEEKDRILTRATRSSYALHRTSYSIMEDNREKLSILNKELFGNTKEPGAIHQLAGAIDKMNIVLRIVQWVGVLLAGVILTSIASRWVGAEELESPIVEQAVQTESIDYMRNI